MSDRDGDKEDRDRFDLDKHRLDEEWLEQPRLYRQEARKLADLRKAHKEAEAFLELTEAEIKQDIRKNPTEFGLEKITEGAVSEVVVIQQKYRKAQQKMFDAQHLVDLQAADVTSLDHRKKALEKEVDLYLAGYFAQPRASKGSHDAVETMKKDKAFGSRGKK